MRIITIREDALQVLEDNAVFPMQKQVKAAEAVIHGKTISLYYIDIDSEVESHIKSKGINLNDIDQVSDFILSVENPNH